MSKDGKSIFYSTGKLAGKKLSKASWIWYAVTGDNARSRKAEYRVGKEIHQQLMQNLSCIESSRADNLVKQTGKELVRKLKTRELPFNFELLKGGEINAFAVPGGFVFINSSLIEFCEYDRDKIAFVLAHEIAHIVKGHAVERVLTEAAASSAIKAGKISGALGAWIRKAGFKFLQTGYSRYQETEADTFAVQLMQAAGFQSGKAIEFLQNLEDSKGQRDGWDISKYFSTHPEFKARIETIRKNLKQFE